MGRVDQTDRQAVVGAVLLEFRLYNARTLGAENGVLSAHFPG